MIVPVAPEDVVDTSEKQWLTRVLYNAYLPFNYSYILDTHVFPCYNDSYSRIFSLFKESYADVSASCRVGGVVLVFGAAVLSKWGEASHEYWKNVYNWMLERMWFDDQRPMLIYSKNTSFWKYRWLSSNWIWASHGIEEKGIFSGPSKCYRSSVIVTGPVMWVHGGPGECMIMNGQNNSVAFKKRAYFLSGECEMKKNGPMVVFTKEQLDELVSPQKPPLLNWSITRDATSLFWEYWLCLFQICTNWVMIPYLSFSMPYSTLLVLCFYILCSYQVSSHIDWDRASMKKYGMHQITDV